MATSYEIFKDIELVVVTSSGPAITEEVIDMLIRLQADPDFSITYNVLWDSRERTIPFTSDEIRNLVSYVHRYKGDKIPKPKRAFLVSKDVVFGMLRVYESYRSGISHADIQIFRDRDEALKWLGVHDYPLFCTNNSSGNDEESK